MNRTMTMIATLTLLGGAFGVATFSAEAGSNPSPRSDGAVAFGMDARSIGKQSAAGVKPDYGTIWVGPWVFKSGWGDTQRQLDNMKSKGVTPAIHFYYWGDDISKNCLENGCWSSLHNVHKSQSGWNQLAKGLNHEINSRMGGKPVVIFLETEFNKGDVQNYERLDAMLRDKANYFKWNTKNAHVTLALGNWNSGSWSTWDRAAGASHSIGLQGMRGSTRDSWSEYMSLYESTLSGVKKAKSTFGKPVIIHDIALSSYPNSQYLGAQRDSLKEFFDGLPSLKAAGVKGIIYREWSDNPRMDLANYYGQAERHWGLTYDWGSHKPSAKVWINGVQAERGGGSGSTGTSGSFSATFAPASSVNEWWVDVSVKGTETVSKVHVKVNGGSWVALSKSDWGTWTKSMNVPKGSSVVFKATSTSGNTDTSGTYNWLSGSSPSSGSTFSATFTPASSINEWWVDVAVKGDQSISKVHVKVNGGSWVALSKSSWGTWTKSMNVPKGSSVVFKATSTSGATDTSGTYSWLSGSGGSTGSGSSGSDFSATFAPASSVNEWWIDVDVKGTKTVSKVHAKVNGGSWVALSKSDWGTWTKSMKVPKGSSVVFKATSSSGETSTSKTYTWLSSGSGSGFSASFAPSSSVNSWWIDVDVKGTKTVSKVHVKVNGGSWVALSKTDWGTWAKSTHAPKGSSVVFKATSSSGETDTSKTYTW